MAQKFNYNNIYKLCESLGIQVNYNLTQKCKEKISKKHKGKVLTEENKKKVIESTGSSSKIITEDYGYRETPYLFDLRKIERDFGFSFTCREKIIEHIRYIQTLFTSSINA